MSELKFKVGDQVICNGERRDCSGEIVNIKGTIVKINTELDTPYEVQLHQSVLVDYQWWFRESQLELLKEEPKFKTEPFAEGTVSMEVPISLKEDVEELILDRNRQKKEELVDTLEKIILNTSIRKDESLMSEAKAMISLYRDHLEDNGEV